MPLTPLRRSLAKARQRGRLAGGDRAVV